MRARFAVIGVTRAAKAVFQREEGMFHPGVADLFEPLGVIYSTAHSIKILRNDRVIGLRQRKPVDWLVAVVTRVCSHRQANLCSGASHLGHVLDVSNNHVRTGHQVWRLWADCVSHRWHDHRVGFAVNQFVDLDRLHRRAEGDFSNDFTCARRSAECVGKLF